MVAVPARHPLLAYKRIPLDEVLRYPLVMCNPQLCEGYGGQIARGLRAVDPEPLVAEEVTSLDLMLALMAAGYALALVGSSQVAACRNADVVGRPLAGRSPMLTTYLLRRDAEPSEALSRFIGSGEPDQCGSAANERALTHMRHHEGDQLMRTLAVLLLAFESPSVL